jgi:hypothetical protein
MWRLNVFSLAHVIAAASVRNRFSGLAASSSDAEPRGDDGSWKRKRISAARTEYSVEELGSSGERRADAVDCGGTCYEYKAEAQTASQLDTVGPKLNHDHCRRPVSSRIDESAT